MLKLTKKQKEKLYPLINEMRGCKYCHKAYTHCDDVCIDGAFCTEEASKTANEINKILKNKVDILDILEAIKKMFYYSRKERKRFMLCAICEMKNTTGCCSEGCLNASVLDFFKKLDIVNISIEEL